jgi:hypothetical protein
MSRDADKVELELADAMRAYDAAMRERPRDHARVDALAVRLNRLREELRAAERRKR